jgi:hypothetical protein
MQLLNRFIDLSIPDLLKSSTLDGNLLAFKPIKTLTVNLKKL